MSLLTSSDSSAENMLLGVEITVLGAIVLLGSSESILVSIAGQLVVFVGIWFTVSGYSANVGTDPR